MVEICEFFSRNGVKDLIEVGRKQRIRPRNIMKYFFHNELLRVVYISKSNDATVCISLLGRSPIKDNLCTRMQLWEK